MFRRNVLILHAGGLGDFVLTFPLALGLGRLFPQSRIIYVTHGQKGKLAEAALGVESADIEHGWHHLLGGEAASLPPAVRRMVEQAHLVAAFQTQREGEWAGGVRRIAPSAEVVTIDPRPTGGRHVSEQLLNELAAWPAVRAATEQMVRWLSADGLCLPRTSGHRVLIHPGSGGRAKCWPVERFVELASRLRQEEAGPRAPVAVLLGEVEAERLAPADIERLAKVAPVYWPQSHVELLKLLLGGRLFIGNDSGPAHLAGMLGLSTLCLFGPTDPAVWRPLGPRVTVIHEPQLRDLTVATLLRMTSA